MNKLRNILVTYRQDDAPDSIRSLLSGLEKHFKNARSVAIADDRAVPAAHADVSQSAQCDVLVTVIGPDWVGALDSAGHRRLDNPVDFVHQQIKSALHAGVRIIPVLLDGAKMPGAGKLPTELKPFARRKAIACAHEYWERDSRRVIWAIEKALRLAEFKKQRIEKEQQRIARQQIAAVRDGLHRDQMWQNTSRRGVLFLAGAVVALALLGGLGWIWEARWRELTRKQRH
jgi:hypothetical protein